MRDRYLVVLLQLSLSARTSRDGLADGERRRIRGPSTPVQSAQTANLKPKERTMAKRIWMIRGLVVSIVVSVGAQRAFSAQQPVELHVVPLKTFSKMATDKR